MSRDRNGFEKMTAERAKEVIRTMLSDDDLIDMATTCSDRGIALASEMELRRRYPSKKSIKARSKGSE